MRSLILGAILSLLFIQTSHATTLNELASEIVLQPVTVQCVNENGSWDGLVMFSNQDALPVIYMVKPQCRVLTTILTKDVAEDWIMRPDEFYAERAGIAFHTLVHEALHIRMNSTSEGTVECGTYYNTWSYMPYLGLGWKARNRVYGATVRTHESLEKIPPYNKVC